MDNVKLINALSP